MKWNRDASRGSGYTARKPLRQRKYLRYRRLIERLEQIGFLEIDPELRGCAERPDQKQSFFSADDMTTVNVAVAALLPRQIITG